MRTMKLVIKVLTLVVAVVFLTYCVAERKAVDKTKTAEPQAQEEYVPVLQPKDSKSGLHNIEGEWKGVQDDEEQDRNVTPEPVFPMKKTTWGRFAVQKMCDAYRELFPDKVEIYEGQLYRIITGEVEQAFDEVVQSLIDSPGGYIPEPGLDPADGSGNTECLPPE